MFRLDGKVAVVTGASQGIGAAIAQAFAEAGADLLLVARRHGALTEFADKLRAGTGRQVVTVVADVTAGDTPTLIAERARATWSGIDVLVNNAYSSGGVLGPVLDLEDTVWDDVLAANVIAPFRLCRELVPLMAGRSGSSVINVVSGSGFLPSPGIGAYGVSKAALWMLTRQLAGELAPDVRVNALCPGTSVLTVSQPTRHTSTYCRLCRWGGWDVPRRWPARLSISRPRQRPIRPVRSYS